MASTWIIDGYNFIRCSRRFAEWEAERPEEGRLAALEWLGDFAKLTGEAVTVVFDHYSSTESMPQETQRFGIKVMESRGSYTADEEIIELSKQYGEGIIVISSDREVLEGATRAGCSVLNSQEFEREVAKVITSLKNPVEEGEEYYQATKRKGQAFKPPKEKSKAYRLLKKYQSY